MAHPEKLREDLSHHYDKYIILWFSGIARGLRLMSKHVERLQFNEDLFLEEKEFLLEILYQQEHYLA